MGTVGYADDQKIRRRLKRRSYGAAFLLMLPLFLVVFGFFIVPMLYMFYLSFIEVTGLDVSGAAYSIGNYTNFFTDSYYLKALWLTLKISIYTAFVSLIIGYPVAMTMAKTSVKMRGYLTLLVASPLLISVVVRNFGWYLLLLPNGALDKMLMWFGITDSPLKLLFSEIGVVIGLSNAYLPFMILAIATCLYNVDPSLEKAGAIFGASPLKSFVHITLPLSLPGIIAGVVLVFSMSMSAYVTPALMGGANVPVLPVIVYEQIISLFRWTYGSAVSFILLGITIIVVTVVTRLFEKGRFREVFRNEVD